MLAVGDAEVVVGVVGLHDGVRGTGSAEGQDGGGAIGALSVADLFNCHHFLCCGLEGEEEG